MKGVRELWAALVALLRDLYWLLHGLVHGHACEVEGCGCDFYDDTETFRQLAVQSGDPQYAARVLDAGVVGRPLVCDRCAHAREAHARLAPRAIGPECMPNGGAVLIEQDRRVRLARRAARFPSSSFSSSSPAPAADGAAAGEKEKEKEKEKDAVRTEDKRVGGGAEAQYDVHVKLSYVAAFASDGAEFERADSLQFVVGKRAVVPGLDDGVRGMRVGGVRAVSVPPAFAYGTQADVHGRVGETLVFTVTLLSAVRS